jgi:hypothetical protein
MRRASLDKRLGVVAMLAFPNALADFEVNTRRRAQRSAGWLSKQQPDSAPLRCRATAGPMSSAAEFTPTYAPTGPANTISSDGTFVVGADTALRVDP